MNILIGPTQPKFQGGIVEYTHRLADAWHKAGIEATVLSLNRPYPSFLYKGKKRTEHDALPLIAHERSLIDWLCPCSWLGAWWAIRRMHPTVVYIQWWTMFWALPFLVISFLLKRFSSIRVVYIVHNVSDHESSWLSRLLSRLALSQANAFFTHATSLKEELQKLFPHRPVIVQLQPLPPVSKLPHRANSQTLLFFGLVRPYKGLMTLFEAIVIARTQLPRLKLIVAGEFWEPVAPYQDYIIQHHLESVITIDNRFIPEDELAVYFSQAAAAVFPYYSATGTASTKRALAYGVPIIATRVGDVPELFALEKVGVLVEPNDPQELAKAIEQFLIEKRAYHTEFKRIAQKLTWEQFSLAVSCSAV